MSLILAILVSLTMGYLVADWQGAKLVPRRLRVLYSKLQNKASKAKDSRYYGVLTKLLNEQPDEALDQFISKLEVNSDTLEMHLALGAQLRRRGEFDRAVRVHENLLARPGLPSTSTHQVQLELACDYLRSGLLDRAETLLKELMLVAGVAKSARWQAAAYLVEIYQDLGDWLAAIDIADQLTAKKFAVEPDLWRKLQAQFCCELASQALNREQPDLVVQKLRQALAYDPECIRAYILRADIALKDEDSASALVALDHVIKHDASFMSEIVPRIKQCFPPQDVVTKLTSIQKSAPSLVVLTELLAIHAERCDYERCSLLVKTEIERIPAVESERDLLHFSSQLQGESEQRIEAIIRFLKAKQKYVCLQCGTDHHSLVWHCPTCKSWSTVRCVPI